MRREIWAATAAAGLAWSSAASAQMSVEEAHRTVNRLLNGAGVVQVFASGKTLDGAHGRVSSPRSDGRCSTLYNETKLDHPDIPSEYRGKFYDGIEVRWAEARNLRASGDRFYWDQIRKATGRPFTYHFVLGSAGAAEELLAAGRVLAAACQGAGEKNAAEQEPLEQVFDAAAGSASLAIDRRQGQRYGWAIDYPNWSESDARALAECQKNGGGRCQVVLRFTGGCGAYAADQARGSSVYGWGLGTSRQAAENRAWDEARQRGATNLVTRVWGCNSERAAAAAPRVSGASALPGKGKLSDDVIRRNAEAAAAHRAQVEAYERQLKENQAKIEQAVAARKAQDEAHRRELERAAAAKAEYERQRQAYREEYRRVTGRYPEE